MKKNLLLKRILSAVLTIVLLASAIPVSLAVQELFTEELPAQIVREVPELREESVKHFLCDDGSYIAATYAEPVHYNENGVWKEIDNRLILNSNKLSASGEPTYTTRAGLAVSIPQNFADGQKITAENKGYEISFGIKADQAGVAIGRGASVVAVDELMSNAGAQVSAAPQSVSSVVADAELTADVIEERNAELMVVENQAGAVQYRNILPSTNLEYAVTSSSVKESIVVREPQSEYKYYFDMDLDGLTPVENNDGSISLTESGDTANEIFWIEAPYMYDANSDESFAVTMSLTEVEGKYVLVVEADKDWINAADRAFPVVIDPTINIPQSSFDDVFVTDGLFSLSTRRNKELCVGKNLTNVSRIYLKIAMPTNIPQGSVVTSSRLYFSRKELYTAMFTQPIPIYCYDCDSVDSWDPRKITWKNQPFDNSCNGYRKNNATLLSSYWTDEEASSYYFNISEAIQRWIDTGENNGLMLASSSEDKKIHVTFYSSREANNRPCLSFNYSQPGISQNVWNTSAQVKTSDVVEVVSKSDWTASSNEPWLSVTSKSKSGFRMRVSENIAAGERNAEISVRSGDTLIGTITVTQAGSDPSLLISEGSWITNCGEDSKTFVITSNDSWTVESSEPWLTVSPLSGEENGVVTINTSANDGSDTRTGTITLSTAHGTESKSISVTQLDKVSNYFYNVSENGSFGRNSSSDYNHKLATWAMELSYAAYNYPNGEELPIIPGAFMGDFVKSANTLLSENGFVNITDLNYGSNESGAHTIGWRPIVGVDTGLLQISDDIGGNDNVGWDNTSDEELYVWNFLDRLRTLDGNSGRADSGNVAVFAGKDNVVDVIQSSAIRTMPLVVVDVRGTVTGNDWLNDITTQFESDNNRFAALADEVLTNVESYLSSVGLQDPIILVTGHSMGAAIANILASYLNETMDSGNVYAYTFATPRTVNEAVSGNQAVNYPNIFNILNSNDVVTYVPLTITLPVVNYWKRHGIDLYINMPFNETLNTDILGMPCHAMPVYLNWLNSSEDLSLQEMLTLSEEARVRGLLPIIAKIKCPVGVTIKDSNGNIIGYESQQENAVYPDMLNSGVVSWIEEDGAKMFFIPSIADAASIEIEAYDYGSMNFTVGSVDASTESEIKTLNNISLYPGKEFIADISEDVPVEDTQLFITENGETVGEVAETNPHLKGTRVWHEVRNNGGKDSIVTYWSFTTDKTVTEFRVHRRNVGTTIIPPDSPIVTKVEDGDNLIWTVGWCYFHAGDYVYDVLLNSNEEWFTYENALFVHISQEHEDINQEFLASNPNLANADTVSTAAVPAAVPYYTVIEPTDN